MHPPGIHRDGAGDLIVVAVVEDERLDVAVEDQADDFVVSVHDRAARVAADDVCRGDEVERRFQIQSCRTFGLEP